MNKKPTVFVVESHDGDCDDLTAALRHGGLAVTCFPSAEAFLAGYDPAAQGCLVAAARLSGMGGLDLLEELTRRRSRLAIVIVTACNDISGAVRAIRAGAAEVLWKPVDPLALRAAIGQGEQTRRMRWRVEAETILQKLPLLSDRECTVFRRLAAGLLGKEIAAELGISPRTVEIYRANVIAKLGARHQGELIRMGVIAEVFDSLIGII